MNLKFTQENAKNIKYIITKFELHNVLYTVYIEIYVF
jgi:hypothetical protein